MFFCFPVCSGGFKKKEIFSLKLALQSRSAFIVTSSGLLCLPADSSHLSHRCRQLLFAATLSIDRPGFQIKPTHGWQRGSASSQANWVPLSRRFHVNYRVKKLFLHPAGCLIENFQCLWLHTGVQEPPLPFPLYSGCNYPTIIKRQSKATINTLVLCVDYYGINPLN